MNSMAKQEYYPMPSFSTLAVGDISESTLWYSERLGFAIVFQIPGQGDAAILVHLRWAKYADLLLVPGSETETQKGVGVTLNFSMGDRSIDDFAESLKSNDVSFEGPVNQPWNARELTVTDPDGFRLTFTQPVNMDLSIDEVTSSIQEGR